MQLAYFSDSNPNNSELTVKLLDQPGGSVFVAECPVWDKSCGTLNGRDHLLIGITSEALRGKSASGMSWHLGQAYGVVSTGLIMARHVFKGLNRDMTIQGNSHAAADKLAVTWLAPRDALLVGPKFNPTIRYCEAPPKRTFAVYISPNQMLQKFPHIHGWAEHWAWIASDPARPTAPVDWETRYDDEIWTALEDD
jgi:hypothetical protein